MRSSWLSRSSYRSTMISTPTGVSHHQRTKKRFLEKNQGLLPRSSAGYTFCVRSGFALLGLHKSFTKGVI